ncbi:D-arabinitol 2-dehydrogenase [Parachaetomium inaequale]|uniref:D-arabinitol 2-dehydrogenase n=1 Tax=Parachaetomium inaequale TaxID=2588326 RepID=A0AAN6P995_9PEZI|nr:D-arabinitol 2-dehydrogenase [Parachaetomium inaequale]
MNTATRALRLAARQRFGARLPQTTTAAQPLIRLTAARAIHTSGKEQTWPKSTTSPEPRSHPNTDNKPAIDENIGRKRFGDFNVAGKVFVVTGGAQGLGLTMAEALVEAGGKVYALDRSPEPDEQWSEAISRVLPEYGGSLHYRQQDVSDTAHLDELIASIAADNGRLDGVVAAAGVQQVTQALDYTPEDVARMLDVNYTGVFMTAQSAARQMFKYKTRGSICLIASMSGLVANKGLLSPVYNSSKAAVIQLARNLAMEWSPVREDGAGGIRVNCISPGHILTPMVLKNFEEVPGLRETWEGENMMGRLAETTEFKGAVLFLLSGASSFMTGNNLVIDGGHTAW